MSATIGIDIGGTKIAGGVVADDGTVLASGRRETPAQDPGALVAATADLVASLREESGVPVGALGVACAGLVDPTRSIVLFAPNLAWRDEPMRDRLQEATGLPVVVENDANAAAWGEFRHGAAADADDMLLVTVGTGIGGGVVSDGVLLRGAFGVAVEIGHIRLVPEGLRCGCGKKGCWEMYASGSALLRDARERVRAGKADSLSLAERCEGDPERLKGTHVTELAAAGDALALDLLHDLGTNLGYGIASVDAVLNTACIVIGGGVSAAGDLLLEPIRDAFLANLVGRGYRPEPTLLLATLGNDAGVIGVADLARDVLPAGA